MGGPAIAARASSVCSTARRRRGRLANRTPEDRVEAIAALRRLRFTGAQLAELFAMPETTVSGILTRIGMGRLGRLGLEPACRYERERPGELIHVDVKKLGRIERGAGKRITGGDSHYKRTLTDRDGHRRETTGWEYVHIAIDDATRLAYAEVLRRRAVNLQPRFLGRAMALLPPLRHPCRARPDRQRLRLSVGGSTRSRLRRARPQPRAPAHIDRGPTARPNGSSAPCSRDWAYGAIYRSSSRAHSHP